MLSQQQFSVALVEGRKRQRSRCNLIRFSLSYITHLDLKSLWILPNRFCCQREYSHAFSSGPDLGANPESIRLVWRMPYQPPSKLLEMHHNRRVSPRLTIKRRIMLRVWKKGRKSAGKICNHASWRGKKCQDDFDIHARRRHITEFGIVSRPEIEVRNVTKCDIIQINCERWTQKSIYRAWHFNMCNFFFLS